MKKRIKLCEDERYPFYCMVEEDGIGDRLVEVSAKTLARWKRVFKQFDKVQAEMKKHFGG